MAPVGLRSDIDSFNAEVVVETLWQAAESVRKGALTNDVMDAAFSVSEVKFNAYAATLAGTTLKHVFDWGQSENSAGPRLWHTIMTGTNSNRVVTYNFLQSRRKVPVQSPLDKYLQPKHIFREKAFMLENAEPVTIRRKNAKFLVYMASTPASWAKANDEGIVFSKGPSYVEKAGGGEYENNFRDTFLTWWASDLGAGGELSRVAEELGDSFAFRAARVASAERRIAAHSKTYNSAAVTAEGKKRAAKMIAAVKRQMSLYAKRKK